MARRLGVSHFGVVVLVAVAALMLLSPSCAEAEQSATPQNHRRHQHDHAGHSHADSPASDSGPSSRPLFGVLVVYSLLIACSSLLGGWLPGHFRLSHTGLQMLLSLVGGLLLGIGVFHLLAHSIHELGLNRIDTVSVWVMGGMVFMFFLLRGFHVHHHAPAVDVVPDPNVVSLSVLHDLGSHPEECLLDHHDGCGHSHGPPQGRLGWMGLFFGLGVHTLLDGLALGAAMQADAAHEATWFAGLGVLLGIALHKPIDSLSITTLMMQAGVTRRSRWTVNLIYACLCPLGAAAFLLGVRTAGDVSQTIVGCSLAFSSGAFICLALADLLPEMEYHSHDRTRLTVALLLGIVLAWGIRYLEPAHLHH